MTQAITTYSCPTCGKAYKVRARFTEHTIECRAAHKAKEKVRLAREQARESAKMIAEERREKERAARDAARLAEKQAKAEVAKAKRESERAIKALKAREAAVAREAKLVSCAACNMAFRNADKLNAHVCSTISCEAVPNAQSLYPCSFCHRAFRTAEAFGRHACEKKKRYMERDQPHSVLAFRFYELFWKINYSNRRAKRDFMEFMNSRYFNGFLTFAQHVIALNAIQPMEFAEFLMKANVPISKWCSDSLYDLYLKETIKRETPLQAVERNFRLMEQWSNDTGEDWRLFFRRVEPTLATKWIRSGRISPWVLYTSTTARDLLDRMSPEQIGLVKEIIDPEFWSGKLNADQKTLATIVEILTEEGI